MGKLVPFTLLFIVTVGFIAPAEAQFADDTVNSDSYGNTAAVSDALYKLTPTEESTLGCFGFVCTDNTALGQGSLFSNSSGGGNTAVGAYSLETNTEPAVVKPPLSIVG